MDIWNKERGCIVLVGGAEDRKYEKEVLKKIVEINNAQKVAVIPTATAYSRECGESYIDAFSALGVPDVKVVDVRYREDADSEKYLACLDGADLVYFTGGDQVRLVEILHDTLLISKIRELNAHGTTVAGTSAGAAAMSADMIYSWSDDDFLFTKGSVTFSQGFSFLDGVVVDTHFIERGRIPRLTNILAASSAKCGIGVAEDTGAIVYPDNTMEVVGTGLITVLHSEKDFYSNYHEIKDIEPVTVEGVRLTFLGKGAIYDMERGKIVKKENTVGWKLPFIAEPMLRTSLI